MSSMLICLPFFAVVAAGCEASLAVCWKLYPAARWSALYLPWDAAFRDVSDCEKDDFNLQDTCYWMRYDKCWGWLGMGVYRGKKWGMKCSIAGCFAFMSSEFIGTSWMQRACYKLCKYIQESFILLLMCRVGDQGSTKESPVANGTHHLKVFSS